MGICIYAINSLIQHYRDTLEENLSKRDVHLKILNSDNAIPYIFSKNVIEVRTVNNKNNQLFQEQSRYSDFYGKKEARFPTYNMNTVLLEYPHLIVAEGPEQWNDYERLLKNTVHNELINQPFSFLAIGSPKENGRSKYWCYCSSYQSISKHIKIDSNEIDCGNENALSKTDFKFIQVPKWHDMDIFSFTDEEVVFIYRWLDDNARHKVIHCSAGLGRSGTLLLAYALAKKSGDNLLELNEQEAGTLVAKTLIEMRQNRPGLVHSAQQLKMAIDLAFQMVRALKKACENKSSDVEGFQLLNAVHPPAQPYLETPLQHAEIIVSSYTEEIEEKFSNKLQL